MTDALLELIHRYYPAGLESEDPRYAESEEGLRLTQLINAHVGGTQPWKDFIQRLHQNFSDCSIWDATVPYHDPCFICRVSQPGFVVGSPRYDSAVCLLSQLAPVYVLYASHVEDRGLGLKRDHWLGFPPLPAEFQDHEKRLAELIETTFGATACPMTCFSLRCQIGCRARDTSNWAKQSSLIVYLRPIAPDVASSSCPIQGHRHHARGSMDGRPAPLDLGPVEEAHECLEGGERPSASLRPGQSPR